MAKRFCTKCGKELTGGAFCTGCGAPDPGAKYNQSAMDKFKQSFGSSTNTTTQNTGGYNSYNGYSASSYGAAGQKKIGGHSPIAIIGIVLLGITFLIFTIAGFIAGGAFMNEAPPEMVMLANTLLGGRGNTTGIYATYGFFMFLPIIIGAVSALIAGVKKQYGIGAGIAGIFMVIGIIVAVSALVMAFDASSATIAKNYTYILTGTAYLAGVIASIWTFIPALVLLIIAQVKKK